MTSVPSSYFLYNVRYTPLDSVNLVFEGFQDPSDVMNTLIQNAGWSNKSIQAHQYLQNDRNPAQLDIEFGFLVKATRRGSLVMNHLWRFHMRVWERQSDIVGCAHEERPGFLTHAVVSFDNGRDEIARDFSRLFGYTVTTRFRDSGTRIVSPPCDGFITLIKR